MTKKDLVLMLRIKMFKSFLLLFFKKEVLS